MDAVDSPTRNLASTILRRENLLSLAREANLVQRFEETRPPALRLKDRVTAGLFGTQSDEDKLASLAFTLEQQVTVEVKDDATVILTVDWSNPQIAYALVTLVQKNFQEARYDSDVALINDSIAVLEDRAKSALERVDEELEAYRKVLAERATAERTLRIAATPATPTRVFTGPRRATAAAAFAAPGEPDPDLAKALEEKRQRIRELEGEQERTLDGLKQQLQQAQLTLTPMHPTVIALQQRIDTVRQQPPPPELAQLKSDERSLMGQIAPPAIPAGTVSAPSALPTAGMPPLAPFLSTPLGADAGLAAGLTPLPVLEDGVLQLEQSKLGADIHSYQDTMARIDAAKAELDVTSTAYRHRYVVVTPAMVPGRPKKPIARNLMLGSLLGGLLLAILLASGLDIASGYFIESWQIRRQLKLDVLAEFDNPP
jgi:hypothetical protein